MTYDFQSIKSSMYKNVDDYLSGFKTPNNSTGLYRTKHAIQTYKIFFGQRKGCLGSRSSPPSSKVMDEKLKSSEHLNTLRCQILDYIL